MMVISSAEQVGNNNNKILVDEALTADGRCWINISANDIVNMN